jgi:hypothetical protein
MNERQSKRFVMSGEVYVSLLADVFAFYIKTDNFHWHDIASLLENWIDEVAMWSRFLAASSK